MRALAGAWRLILLALRRDRIKLPVWIVAIVGLIAVAAPSIKEVYGASEEALRQYALTTSNSMVARMLGGPIDGPQLGSVMMVEYFLFISVLIAFMSSLAVVRHTRQNEETGRSELIGSARVGRFAPLTAALTVVIGANILITGLMALALIANDMPVGGSVAMATGLGGVGVAFAAIAAVCAQVVGTSRGASAAAGAVIGSAILLRAIGDGLGDVARDNLSIDSAWPVWLSPIGWGQQMHPFAGTQWWPLALFGAFAFVLIGVSFWLVSHRDHGMGMIAERSGRAKARKGLLSSFGLAWRLQRTVLLGWAVGITVLGATLGVTAVEFRDFFAENEQLAAILQQAGGGMSNPTDMYFAAMMGFMAIALAGYALQAALRLQSEESGGRLEPVLAASVTRFGWVLSHVGIVVGGVLALGALAGLATGVAYALVADDVWSEVAGIMGAGLVHVPAVLVFVGFATVVFALLPRLAGAFSWGAFAVCLLIVQLGELLKLPDWANNISPFTHTPAAPSNDLDVAPLVMLSATALGLIIVGLLVFRRRDIETA